MLSVVYVTNRPVECVVGPERNAYRLLADSLQRQTLPPGLWELVVVDKSNELPRPELAWCGERVRYVRHRRTPWGDAFAPSIPRNDGLRAAQGEVVFGLDDGVSFGLELLAAVYRYANAGQYLAPVWKGPSDLRTGGSVTRPQQCGGILAYPRALAVELGGHPEAFAATIALEDWSFSSRLVRHGCQFVCDPSPALHVITHRTGATQRPGVARCCYAVQELTDRHPTANQPWGPGELDFAFGPVCGFLQNGACSITTRPCTERDRPSAAALDIMRTYESQPYSLFP